MAVIIAAQVTDPHAWCVFKHSVIVCDVLTAHSGCVVVVIVAVVVAWFFAVGTTPP